MGRSSDPATKIMPITPSDDDYLDPIPRGIRCSGDCILHILDGSGADVAAVPFFKGDNPIVCKKIFLTGTTLSGASLWGLSD